MQYLEDLDQDNCIGLLMQIFQDMLTKHENLQKKSGKAGIPVSKVKTK